MKEKMLAAMFGEFLGNTRLMTIGISVLFLIAIDPLFLF